MTSNRARTSYLCSNTALQLSKRHSSCRYSQHVGRQLYVIRISNTVLQPLADVSKSAKGTTSADIHGTLEWNYVLYHAWFARWDHNGVPAFSQCAPEIASNHRKLPGYLMQQKVEKVAGCWGILDTSNKNFVYDRVFLCQPWVQEDVWAPLVGMEHVRATRMCERLHITTVARELK